jgi:protein-disulfide isomerase
MREISKFLKIFLLVLLVFTSKVESKILSIGNTDAKIVVKVFSSLTCPHCATFHSSVFNKLKEEYIDKGLVKFEHHAFPLDLAALNAEIIIRCQSDNEKKFKFLEEVYKKQKFWAIGSDINNINNLIKKIGLNFDLSEKNMNKCLKNDDVQDEILNQRVEAQKTYKIESTPTIIVNEKKYLGKVDYKSFKKFIEKNL